MRLSSCVSYVLHAVFNASKLGSSCILSSYVLCHPEYGVISMTPLLSFSLTHTHTHTHTHRDRTETVSYEETHTHR